MVPLTNTYLESYASRKNCYICKEKLKANMLMIKHMVMLEM